MATHFPLQKLPTLPAGDKWMHFAGFALLAAAYGFALMAQGVPWRRRIVVAAVTMALYAMFDEVTQPLVNRHADVADWLADTAGALFGIGVLELAIKAGQRTVNNDQ